MKRWKVGGEFVIDWEAQKHSFPAAPQTRTIFLYSGSKPICTSQAFQLPIRAVQSTSLPKWSSGPVKLFTVQTVSSEEWWGIENDFVSWTNEQQQQNHNLKWDYIGFVQMWYLKEWV